MEYAHYQRSANRNLSYRLAESIGTDILIAKYQPGDILPGEMQLCKDYDVSRTAVREAIKMLAAKGMVLPRPRIGTRVLSKKNWNYLDKDLLAWIKVETHPAMLDEFKLVRSLIEPEAAAQCALNASPAEKEDLANLYMAMAKLKDNFNQKDWIRLDTEFHQKIYFFSDNHFLSPFGNLFKAIFEKHFLVLDTIGIERLEQHKTILDAINAGDAIAARKATIELLNY